MIAAVGSSFPEISSVVLAIVLFAFMRTQMVIGRAEAWILLALYAGFVVWMGLETAGSADSLPW